MKTPLLSLLGLVLALAGCATDGSTPGAPAGRRSKTLTPEELAKLPPVVIVTIDSTYDSPNVIVNGFNAGFAPRDIYLEVNEDGTLPYAVTISVDPSGHSDSRAASMLGSSRGPQILSKSYGAGRVPPRKLSFSAVVIREEGQATDRAKPGTSPTASRQDSP